MSRRLAYTLLGLLTAATLGGCQNDFTGTMNLDTSGVALQGTENVVLAIKRVELGGDGRQTNLDFGTEITVDLDLSRSPILQDVLVPAGDYKWVRLEIDPTQSYVIASNGGRYALDVPNIFQSTSDFTVGEGQTADMLVDVDLRQALSFETQGGVRVYTLKPLSRLLDLNAVGNILGAAPGTLVIGNLSVTDPLCEPEAYVYAGDDVIPEGFSVAVKGGTAPVASSAFKLNVSKDTFSFNVGLLTPGDYTVAITCASADTAGSKSIDFSPTQTVKVTAGGDARVDF